MELKDIAEVFKDFDPEDQPQAVHQPCKGAGYFLVLIPERLNTDPLEQEWVQKLLTIPEGDQRDRRAKSLLSTDNAEFAFKCFLENLEKRVSMWKPKDAEYPDLPEDPLRPDDLKDPPQGPKKEPESEETESSGEEEGMPLDFGGKDQLRKYIKSRTQKQTAHLVTMFEDLRKEMRQQWGLPPPQPPPMPRPLRPSGHSGSNNSGYGPTHSTPLKKRDLIEYDMAIAGQPKGKVSLQRLQLPKFQIFSGDKKGEVAYTHWRTQVLASVAEPGVVREAMMQSLRGSAANLAMMNGSLASVTDILATLDAAFGEVSTTDTLMGTFYHITQKKDESVTEYGTRLKEACFKVVTLVPGTDITMGDPLTQRFFQGLHEGYKAPLRYLVDREGTTFDLLFTEARKLEAEKANRQDIKVKSAKLAAGDQSNQDKDPDEDDSDEDDKSKRQRRRRGKKQKPKDGNGDANKGGNGAQAQSKKATQEFGSDGGQQRQQQPQNQQSQPTSQNPYQQQGMYQQYQYPPRGGPGGFGRGRGGWSRGRGFSGRGQGAGPYQAGGTGGFRPYQGPQQSCQMPQQPYQVQQPSQQPQPHQQQYMFATGMSQVQCHNCWGWGHYSKNCPTPNYHDLVNVCMSLKGKKLQPEGEADQTSGEGNDGRGSSRENRPPRTQ